jgi:succinylarginine dihydrolase
VKSAENVSNTISAESFHNDTISTTPFEVLLQMVKGAKSDRQITHEVVEEIEPFRKYS